MSGASPAHGDGPRVAETQAKQWHPVVYGQS
jgi:hypothetical protein